MERRQRRTFTPEFKARTVELIRSSGKLIAQICRELDLTETAVRRWVDRARVDAGEGEGLTVGAACRVRAWEEAEAIRACCDAVEARHDPDTVAADADAAQWLALAREHADRAQQLPRMPADPEISDDRLKPYLGGWSLYGPHRR